MSEELKNNTPDNPEEPQYSLNDDRRVKVLSPGALVAKRFFRNRMAVVGLITLIAMFIFSFVGGMISPYTQDQLFYRTDLQNKEFAAIKVNDEYRYATAPNQEFSSVVQAQAFLAMQKGNSEFEYRGTNYTLKKEGENFYSVQLDGTTIGIAFMDIVSGADGEIKVDFDEHFAILKAYTNQEKKFEFNGSNYEIDAEGAIKKDGKEYALVGRYVINTILSDVKLTNAFREKLIEAIDTNKSEFDYSDENGDFTYTLKYDAANKMYSILQKKETKVFDTYAAPSKEHWLGTDRNGMDMLTRLMYGGRVSLMIGFIVEAIATVLGVIFGGLAGYFGKWVDMLIMRIVDVFYCIPSMPIIIIIGAAMDAMRVNPQVRMIYLMLILGFLGWPGVARMVRGQILSLREQEYMTAAEATGLKVSRRIFKHLVPNVIPQLIVSVTMGLGGTIITEATLSFLGLGVRFPFASWGNIINDVNDTYVLTNYWFIWIPAGICLLVTVLAFNLVGDGLRDAFDPRMKR